MQSICDLHTHSVLSTHAFSSVTENIKWASSIAGLKYLGISEHQTDDCGIGAHKFAIGNLVNIPRHIDDLYIYYGCEFNILDNGKIDTFDIKIERLDYGIASMHPYVYGKHSIQENTDAYIKAMDYPFIKIIGHMDNDFYPCDEDEVIKHAKEKNVLIEVNNSSFSPNSGRKGAKENYKRVLAACKKYQCPIIINSDAHICYDVGKYESAYELIKECQFPEELILNFNEDLFLKYFPKED